VQQVEFRVLGPFEVHIAGQAIELKRRKQRSLLALLLLHTGEVVSTDVLIDELWAGNPPNAAVGSLQNLVSELRKVLGRDTVKTREPGYMLDVDSARVDLHRFERLVAQAAEGGDAETRASLLREALALWRGPPLADLAFEPFAHVEAARLEELRTVAREELIEAELELGRHSQLVGELEALVTENPLRERLRGQLMLALYRSGRQAEALEAYRRAREVLVDELGIDPSAELQRLEQSILRHDAELDLPAVPIPDERTTGERRKTVTVLVADIVDSTSLAAALDPEVLRAVMRRYFDTVRTIVERHGGTIEKFLGDAAMAVFGVPQMHEDDALRAVRSARDLPESLVALNSELNREHGLELRVRIGINTGEVLTGDAAAGQPFATGAAVNVAMRLQQAALPGETLLGASTQALLGEGTEVESVEPLEAGGTHEHIRAFRLMAVDESTPHRRLSSVAFIGRQGELESLETAFRAVRDERRSRTLLVLGEAGLGKTRLASEFVASLGEQASALVGRCVSYGEGATYLPLADIVQEVAPERPRETIQRLLGGDEHAAVVAERIAELIGQAEGTAPTGELFWAVRQLFEGLARRSPLVVVLEDLHWAEPTLLDLVEYLAAWPVETPLFLVCLARPELRDERPGLGAKAQVLRLEPLEDAAIDLLVDELGGAEVGTEMRRRIASLGEGNPLFVEQLLAFLEEAGPEALESVPPSVEALLASRLDRLEPDERALLERCAVVGREFARGAAVHLTPPEELTGLDRRLRTLASRSLIRAVRADYEPDDSFRFYHVLVRDVAYAGITKERRADLHERHGAWLDTRDGTDELVGYHAEQAHRYRRELHPSDPELGLLASWAGERLAAAGIRAWKRADTPATVNLLGRAAALLPADDAKRLELLCELGMAQKVSGDLRRGEATLVEAVEAASSARDKHMGLRAEIELAHLRLFSDPEGASAELLELAAKAVPIFEELSDERALGRTWRHVGYVRGIEGRLGDWQEAVERAVVHYRRSDWSASGCLAELASALFYGPTPVDEALERCEELLDEATDRAGRANVLAFMAGLAAIDGRFDDARLHVAEAARTYEEIGEAYALANNSGRVLGRIEMLSGDAATAGRVLEECCRTLERAQDAAGLSTVAAELADALYEQGRDDEAKSWLDLAQKHAASDDVSAQWSWRRTRAKLLARAGDFHEADSLAEEAVRIVARTDALSDHGAILLDHAEVLRLAERPGEAAERVEEGLLLFDRKGNRVSAEVARAMLSQLTVA
jgi:class 3 adenylate cyclase/DNA-binding winged helix-turn-helix (wHTH) protein